jgi:hypothetical protein
MPIPRNKLVEIPMVPCVSKVAKGDIYEENIEIELPLKTSTPYSNDHHIVDLESKLLMFELGYFVAKPGTENYEKKVKSETGLIYRFSPFPPNKQNIICSSIIIE